ncbi:MAG TPA: DUF72 domain-containing protein [Acidimicrobiia bacterium]|nr:DUF72 domain-containing protein [Acidimicrobiia bacterium]
MGRILVGTASWTDKSLIQSGWYPDGATSAEARLKYYASQFPLVEVDSTYYYPPRQQVVQQWAQRTPPGFTFNIKAFSVLTQHPTKATALPAEMRPEGKDRVYPKDLDEDAVEYLWSSFFDSLAPLDRGGKLGAVLFQFPPWFTIRRSNKDYLVECAERAKPFRICVEFRHTSWMTEDNRDETLEFLESHGLPYVCVDMPQSFRSSVPPVVAATSPELAVMRFHGHNDAEWESGSVQKRFRYLYSERELRDWAPRVQELAGATAATHVLFNNCYEDYAQRNGAELARLLEET